MEDFEEAQQESAAGLSMAMVVAMVRKKRGEGETSSGAATFDTPVVKEGDYDDATPDMAEYNKTLGSLVYSVLYERSKENQSLKQIQSIQSGFSVFTGCIEKELCEAMVSSVIELYDAQKRQIVVPWSRGVIEVPGFDGYDKIVGTHFKKHQASATSLLDKSLFKKADKVWPALHGALKHYEACLRACNVVLTRNALLPHVPNTTIEFRYTRYYMANQRALQALA